MQVERSGTTNKKKEMQTDVSRKLLCDLVKKIYPSSFRNWPILNLVKPEFIIQICMVMVYGNEGSRALIVTWNKNVYTLDYNKDDHLKMNDTHMGLYPKKVKELCGKNIKTFTCNSAFVLAVTERGVYSWKFSEFESDKRSVIPNMQPTPTRVVFEECIVDVACGSHHSLALTSDGQVYAWGDNSYGQVGIHMPCSYRSGYTQMSNKVDMPTLIPELKEKSVLCIACGSKFNMVVTDEGKLYGWGDNKSGQINYKYIMNRLNLYKYYAKPFEIAVNNKVIVKVACGFEHTLALTDEGKVYAWGNNNKGQIGVHNTLPISVLALVDIPELVLDIGASANFSVAVGTNKTVYVWGDCFDQKITTPFLTELSTIHDAFAHSTIVMHKPWAVSNCDIKKVLNLFRSLGLPLNVLEMEFDDPKKCNQIVEQAITSSNVAFFYSKAIEYKAKEFEEFCFQFALRHMKDVVLSEDYLKLDINIRNNFIQRAAKENIFRT